MELLNIDEWRLERENSFRKVFSGDLKEYVSEMQKSGKTYNNNKGDIVTLCPYCYEAYKHDRSYSGVYKKKRLYVDQDIHMGHCFRCDNLFVQYNDQDISIDELINQKFEIESYYLRNMMFEDEIEVLSIKQHGDYGSIDYFNSLDNRNEIGQKYLLEKRHKFFSEKLIDRLNIKFEENGNVVIPFYINNELKFYQSKNIYFDKRNHKENDRPYTNPEIDRKPPYIIKGSSNKWILCEGVFDAIACYIMSHGEFSVMALLGSTLSNYHAQILKDHIPDYIVIMMDEYSISQKIQNALSVKSKLKSSIIYTDGRDPEERMKDMIDEGYGEKIFNWIQKEVEKLNKKEIFSGLEKFI